MCYFNEKNQFQLILILYIYILGIILSMKNGMIHLE